MTIFAALLPGLRHMRTPLTCGVLLGALVVLRVDPSGDGIAANGPAGVLWGNLEELPALIQLSALTFAAYLLGIVWEQLLSGLLATWRTLHGLLEPTLREQYSEVSPDRTWIRYPRPVGVVFEMNGEAFDHRRIGQHSHRNTWFKTPLQRLRDDPKIDSLIRGAILRHLNTPATSAFTDFIPSELVINDFRESALGMAAPDNLTYQKWDRLESEAEFRAAIALPILGYLTIISEYVDGLSMVAVATLILLVAAGILFAARRASHESATLLATALYQGTTQSPALNALKEDLERAEISSHVKGVEWLINYFSVRHRLDSSGRAAFEAKLEDYALREGLATEIVRFLRARSLEDQKRLALDHADQRLATQVSPDALDPWLAYTQLPPAAQQATSVVQRSK